MTEHKSGFVNIMGEPNVGKSTLLNALIGEKLSIITDKPQTTRHRIIAILNDNDYQIVFSDTPGIISDPGYKMQSAMNSFAFSAIEDADILLFMVDGSLNPSLPERAIRKLKNLDCPLILVINKVDKMDEHRVSQIETFYREKLSVDFCFSISALHKLGVESLLGQILSLLPKAPPYYPKDQFTDRSERFFVSEIIREKILELYHQEIPYSCEVYVTSFTDRETKSGKIIAIEAEILVNRKTQKAILIGKQGSAIKKLGIAARLSIEEFLGIQVFLQLYVKVKEKWRDDERSLKSYGYLH